MRIIYVIDSMTKDGAESQLLKTLARLSPERYEAYVVLSRAMGARAAELAEIPCVREVAAIVPEGKRATLLEKAFILGGIVKALQPQLVHSWLWYSNFLCGFSRKLGFWRRVPFIASQRGDYHARYGKLRLWFTEKFIYHTADTVLTNSEHIQRGLCQRYPDKQIFAIPNLLELPEHAAVGESSRSRKTDEKLIVSVGRFAPEKGHRYLIEALGILNDARFSVIREANDEVVMNDEVSLRNLSSTLSRPTFCHSRDTDRDRPSPYETGPTGGKNARLQTAPTGESSRPTEKSSAPTEESALTWRCTFLGEGELEAELRALASEIASGGALLPGQITFPGFCDDVFSVLATADVFVLPSLHESSPNALIEAMGIGLPCIASDVGGIADLLEDGKNGLCVPPKEPEALAAALHRLLTEPEFAQELGKNARLTIQQKFNNDESIRKLEQIYRHAVEQTP